MSAVKGIILAGGSGTRLYPLTLAISKQLLPVYDKPMIYYPLSTLMLAGIRDILIITTPHDQSLFQALLGDGAQFGLSSELRRAALSRTASLRRLSLAGTSSATIVARSCSATIFSTVMAWGRFCGPRRPVNGATIFAYEVADPERYGVVTFDEWESRNVNRGETKIAKIELGHHRALFL